MSSFFKFLGVFIMISGFVLGSVSAEVETGYYYSHTEFMWEIAFIYWFASLISGMLFIAFGAILDYLHDIAKYSKKLYENVDHFPHGWTECMDSIVKNVEIIKKNTLVYPKTTAHPTKKSDK